MIDKLAQVFIGIPSLLVFLLGIIVGLVYSLAVDYVTRREKK